MRLLGATGSHVGNVREANQDRVFFGGRLAALADGMGGHQGGERAAELAIGHFRRAGAKLSESDLVDMILAANQAVHGHAAENGLTGMGTTLVALTLHDDSTMTVVNVGDSRAYWIRGDYMSQVTLDHSFVEDLVRQGRLTPEEAASHPQRNILTRAIGIGVEVEVDRFPIEEPAVGDRFLLCSDGLFNELQEDEILAIVLDAVDPGAAAEALIEATLQTPCRDNVTVAIVEVVADDDPRLEGEGDRREDDGVITNEYLDSDANAITAPIPVVHGAVLRPGDADAGAAGPGSTNGDEARDRGPATGNARGSAEIGTRPGTGEEPDVGDRDRRVGAVALVDDDSDIVIIDDPEAALDTTEMDLMVDDPLEVRPRSRVVLMLGSLTLLAGLVIGGFFAARALAYAEFYIDEDPATGTLAIFQGRRDGLFGLFDPEVVDGSQTELEPEAVIRAEMPAVNEESYGDLAEAEQKLTEIRERQPEPTDDELAPAAAGPSDGTADQGDADRSESTQLTDPSVPAGETSGAGSTTEGG